MENLHRNLLLLVLILSFNTSKAQFKSQFSSGTEPITYNGSYGTHLTNESAIYFGGVLFERNGFVEVVKKLDTQGKTIWSTIASDTSLFVNADESGIVQLLEDSLHLYAFTKKTNLLKINKDDGKVLWKIKVDSLPSRAMNQYSLIDYNQSTLIVATRYESPFQGTRKVTARIYGINKQTSQTSLIRDIGAFNAASEMYAVNNDAAGNLYYTKEDTIVKLSANDFTQELWRRESFPNMNLEVARIHIDNNNRVFLFGNNVGNGAILEVSPIDGRTLWRSDIDVPLYNITQLKQLIEKDSSFYCIWETPSWRGTTVASKHNKNSGNEDWLKIHDFGAASQASSFALDNKANMYVVGSFGISVPFSFNSTFPNAYVLKLNTHNGSTIYEKRFSSNGLQQDTSSGGLGALVVNNKPYFFFQMQKRRDALPFPFDYIPDHEIRFVGLDSTSGNITENSLISDGYEFPCVTKKIISTSNGFIALKEMGRNLWLEKYKRPLNLEWRKQLNPKANHIYKGEDMQTNSNGEIMVVLREVTIESAKYPYYHPYSYGMEYPLSFVLLDSTGTLINTIKDTSHFSYSGRFENYALSSQDSTFYYLCRVSLDLNGFGINKSSSFSLDNLNLRPFFDKDVKNVYLENDQLRLFERTDGSLRKIVKTYSLNTFQYTNTDTIFNRHLTTSIEKLDSNYLFYYKGPLIDSNLLALYSPWRGILWEKAIGYRNNITKTSTNIQDSVIYVLSGNFVNGEKYTLASYRLQDGSLKWERQIHNTLQYDSRYRIIEVDIQPFKKGVLLAYSTKDSIQNPINRERLKVIYLDDSSSITYVNDEFIKVENNLKITTGLNGDAYVYGHVTQSDSTNSAFIYYTDTSSVNSTFNIQTKLKENELFVYPNPTKEYFRFEIEETNGMADIEVNRLNGEKVIEQLINLEEQRGISLNLTAGLYVGTLKIKNGKTYWFKIVVQ